MKKYDWNIKDEKKYKEQVREAIRDYCEAQFLSYQKLSKEQVNHPESKEKVNHPEPKEQVNHPERYGGDTTYECIKVLEAWCSTDEYRGFLKCNAIKYLCRAGKKDEIVQELKKTVWYVNKLIESYEKEEVAR